MKSLKGRKLSDELKKTVARVGYYAAGVAGMATPKGIWQRQNQKELQKIASEGLSADTLKRVNYYNKLTGVAKDFKATPIHSVSKEKSRHYLDFFEVARGFSRDLEVDYSFYDRTSIPEVPGLVKARPIHGENQNSVLIQLDRFRFFTYPQDKVPFSEKQPRAIWRGLAGNNEVRRVICRRFAGNPRADIGSVKATEELEAVPFMSIEDQLNYRYILAMEGNEMCSSLLWTLASNSICLAPPFKFESWFMEGLLEDGVHYVGLAPDGSDLEEKLDDLESNPEKAREINHNAHQWIAQFFNRPRERMIGRLVLMKYFLRTGQWEPDSLTEELFRE